ncbi:MAG: efflux RND transporter periplasmic adaptor subunit [Eubacterium sp.]|nr:efflux RND transporter periplasmic adaptor subunit [Eubacterium sp.]
MIKYLFHSNRIKKTVAAVLIFSFVLSLTACAGAGYAVPELKEPVSLTEFYRPVSKRIVGTVNMLFGTVIAKEYPVFATKMVAITDIEVGVGDYVKEGDVIAHGTYGDMSATITSLRNQISVLDRQRVKEQKASDARVEKLELEKKNEKKLKDKKGMAQKDTSIQIEKENLRFSLAMIDNSIADIRKQISEIEESTGTVTFTAPHSGRVDYVVDMTHNNMVSSYENIAVVIDEDDLYIETRGVTIDNYVYDDYQSKWTYVGGKMVEIKDHAYTNQEISYAKSVKKNPYMSFDAPGSKLELGNNMMLYFMREDNTPKLAVGKDSVYYENDEEYVYVRNEKTGINEKRMIEIGASDVNYVEVVSGLEEGEIVSYKNTMLSPDHYEVVDVETATFTLECEGKFVDFAYPYYDIYTSEVSGEYKELHITGPASPGEPLFNVISNTPRDEIEEARLAVTGQDNDKAQADKDYESAKKDLEKVIKQAKKHPLPKDATETDAVRNLRLLAERTQCDLDVLTYEHDYALETYNIMRPEKSATYQRLLKGTAAAPYTPTVQNDGRISYLNFTDGVKINKNDFVLTVEKRKPEEENTRIYVLSEAEYSPRVGQEMRLIREGKDGFTITGKCVGINGEADRFILFTRDDKCYSTTSMPSSKSVTFQCTIEMDKHVSEKEIKETMVKYYGVEAKDVIVVPTLCVKTEVDQFTLIEKHYVWRLENDVPVKEYVEVFDPSNETGGTYVLSGLEVGDKILK